MSQLYRPITEAIRPNLTWDERWRGRDAGLIWNWERGRQLREADPDLAARAEAGELVTLSWKGGTANLKPLEPGKTVTSYGSLQYLAQWQGLRGEDLTIRLEEVTVIVCTARSRSVGFRRSNPADE